jgi:hypothetical protein
MKIRRLIVLCASLAVLATGCATSSRPIQRTRIPYNEAVKTTNEEQLLLNIVRLRYTDTPSSLAVSSIAAQFEVQKSLGITPFFAAQGAGLSDQIKRFSSVLPQAQVTVADRPTISLTPMDDSEFTRRLFTPLTLESILYLAKTTWPISTVFRLYLENLNWVPNAQLASGPTPQRAPPYADFLRGVQALQALQDRGQIVFGTESREETAGGPIGAAEIKGTDLVEAAKNGLSYQRDPAGKTWSLRRKVSQPVMHVDPRAHGTAEMREVLRTFHLQPGLSKYDVTLESLPPFSDAIRRDGFDRLDLETRSLLQTLYFVSHGIEVPADHVARGIAAVTRDEAGRPFDWSQVTRGLFRVRSIRAKDRPAGAHVAVQYADHWYFIESTDHVSKSTFSLILELSRLELNAKVTAGPVLTLPIGAQ